MVIRELNEELAAVAKKELGEDASRVQTDLQSLRDWLVKQQHLKCRTDDQWLIAFLRGCKFSLERTKEKLDNYYTMKSMIPEIAGGVDPMEPLMQELMDIGLFVILPKPCGGATGPRVTICRPGLYDEKKFNVIELLRLIYLYSVVRLMEDDQIIVAGHYTITDSSSISLSHLSQLTPSNIRKLVMSGQEILPVRQKGMHHINNPAGTDIIFSLFKGFLNEKNRTRFHVHSNIESLYQYVPKEILPTEYGGNAGPIKVMTDEWKKKIEGYRQWFLDDVQYKTDESKRPGKPKTAEGLFGVEGSFRQLAID